MALVLIQPMGEPVGQYPLLASIVSTIKGGEVCTLGTVNAGAQTGAADLQDGYQDGGLKQVVLTTTLASSSTKPLFLLDDGLLHYGTLFGSVVGGTVGTTSFGPNSTIPAADQLGPPTALASGKGSVWRGVGGIFGVTLDNVAASCQPSTYTNTSGSVIYAATSAGSASTDGAGVLTAAAGGGNVPCGYFLEFRSNGSLVTTPNRLVSALNSPSSVIGGVLPPSLYMLTFCFDSTL